MSASGTVLLSSSSEVAGGVQARHRLRERLQGADTSPVAHAASPRNPSAPPRARWSSGRGEIEGAPGVFGRACHIASCLGERGPVDGDGRRQRLELLGVSPRGSLAVGYGGQRALRVVESGLERREVAGDHQHVSVEDAEHRAAPDGGVGQFLQPTEQHRFLPVAADRRRGQLHQVGRVVEVLGGQGVPYRLLGQVVALVPPAGALVQQRNLVGLLAEQARSQHVGEQVVVAVPLPAIVQGDEEQVGALQGRRACRCRPRGR